MELAPPSNAGVEILEQASGAWGGLHADVRLLGWRQAAHRFPLPAGGATLCMVVGETGGLVSFCDGRGESLPAEHYGAGQIAWLPRPADVAIVAKERAEAQIALFRSEDVHAVGEFGEARVITDDDVLRTCGSLIAQACRQGDQGSAYLSHLAVAFHVAVDAALRRPIDWSARSGKHIFDAATRFIDDYLDQKIPIRDLAAATGRPSALIMREFTHLAGVPPQRWQLEERIRWAQRLMMEGVAPSFVEIARWTGFADQSHFSRAFTQVVGQSPSQWLRQRS